MGNSCSRLSDCCPRHKDARILLLGLDNAGKTSTKTQTYYIFLAILYKLKVDTQLRMIPTVGFNVESIILKRYKLNIWDVGGQDKIRPLWRHYFTGTKGLIFVIDSADPQRLEEAAIELHRVMSDREMRNVVLLVFANKQDVALIGVEEITGRLRLGELRNEMLWKVQPSCATSGEGLVEGLLWLVDALDQTM